MTIAALSAMSTALKIGDGATPENFTTIAEVKSIGGPALTAENVDATSLDSAGGWREVLPIIKDAGEITLEINYVPTEGTHDASTGLLADLVAEILRNFQIVWPDAGATPWSYSAYVTGFTPTGAVGDLLTASVTLRVSGQPTLA